MLLTLISLCLAAPAGATPRTMISLAREGVDRPSATLADLAWLEGSWTGDMPQGPVEHIILPARYGQMPSFVRALSPGGISFYEISVFTEANGSLVSRVKHFTPELAGWEGQASHVARPLVARAGGTFRFDGLTLARTGPDSFTVYFLPRDPDGREGETLVIAFRRTGPAKAR